MKEQEQIILGCLLHDIGKFLERAEVLNQYRDDQDKRQQYCKWNDEKNYFSHIHVLHTLAFCEQLCELVPVLMPEERQTNERADQNWINLASYHHKPSKQQQAYLEQIVQAADHFASAEREKGDFYAQGIHKKTHLESLLGRINIGSASNRENIYFLPLSETRLTVEAIYPQAAESLGMSKKEGLQGKGWLRKHKLTAEYQVIAENFMSNLENLQTFQPGLSRQKIFGSVLRSLLTLMEQTLNQIPSATNVLHPDISLFDHLRITAAIGEGLYLFHRNKGDVESANYEDKTTVKWQLVCGDFSGIQKFIYKITSKGAAKGLRGRSLFIQLLCDAVSEHLLRKLGLYISARIYSSGGKFYLLIPSHLRDTLLSEVDKINADMLREFQGEVFLGLGIADVTSEHFRGGNMGQCWKAANEDLQRRRLQPFIAQVSTDIDCFAVHLQSSSGSCQICGRDDEYAGIEDGICSQCKDLQKIGQHLEKANYLFWAWNGDRKTVANKLKKKLHEQTMPGTDCTLYFLEQPPEFSELTDLSDSHLETINHWQGFTSNPQGYSQGIRYIGKWQKEKDSGEWEFDQFADNAHGIKRMGVLRMDVDNLGQVFIRGLRFQTDRGETEMGSLSRVATLSRQLHLFFAGYLHQILSEYKRSQIIYAGGDDVFIIGSWDELPEVAERIRKEFQNYCANNPNFTLSGGIATVGGKYPISRSAQLAGKAEESAKNLRRAQQEKDALCFLDTPIGWESYDAAKQLRDDIVDICKETKNHALIERLRQVVISVQEVKQRQSQLATDQQIQELIYWDKWRWRLVYNLKRMSKRHSGIEDRLTSIQKQLTDNQGLNGKQPALDWLQLSVRWAEFLMRKNEIIKN